MSRRWFGSGGGRGPFPTGGTEPAGPPGAEPEPRRAASVARRLWAPSIGRGPAPHRPTVASSLVAALLAVGIVLGFVLVRTPGPPSPSTGRSATPPTTATTAPATTEPPLPRHGTPPGPAVTEASVPAPRPVVALAPPPPPPGPCTPADVVVTTASDESSYPAGSTVTVTTLLRAIETCVLQPVAAGPYACADSVVIADAGDTQVWPSPGEVEQCSPPAAAVLQPGSTESLRAAWNQVVHSGGATRQAPSGTYQAAGTWAWSAGPGRADYEVSARSAPFTVG